MFSWLVCLVMILGGILWRPLGLPKDGYWNFLGGAFVLLIIISAATRKRTLRKLAIKLLTEQQKIVEAGQNLHPADPADFPHLDLNFYRKTQDFFTGHGYMLLGDFRLEAPSPQSDPRCFIRVMAAPDGSSLVQFYQPRPSWKATAGLKLFGSTPRKYCDTIELNAEFNDGTFLELSNCPAVESLSQPPGCRVYVMPIATPPEKLCEEFRKLTDGYSASHPGIVALPVSDRTGFLAFHARRAARSAEYRRSIGYITREELLRNGAKQPLADQLYQEIQKLQKEIVREELP